jgi:GT2 family glycosyltransferase
MPQISIITPWRDHPELIPDYARAVDGAQVVVVDNGSRPDNARALRSMVDSLHGTYLRNDENEGFSRANNQGMRHATGDILVFLNDDVVASGDFLGAVARDVGENALVGPTVAHQLVYGLWVGYLEGWCVAARREAWASLGGWDAEAYPGYYWEDCDLSLRAEQMGMVRVQADWPIQHKGGQTIGAVWRWGDVFERNRATFAARVRPVYERLREAQLAKESRSDPKIE